MVDKAMRPLAENDYKQVAWQRSKGQLNYQSPWQKQTFCPLPSNRFINFTDIFSHNFWAQVIMMFGKNVKGNFSEKGGEKGGRDEYITRSHSVPNILQLIVTRRNICCVVKNTYINLLENMCCLLSLLHLLSW